MFMGCKPPEPALVPGWLHIPAILPPDEFSTGDQSVKITYVQVYIDSLLIGAFNLPADIPVLDPGTRQITLFTGIKENGIAATPALYPFYNAIETVMTFESGKTDTFVPTASYKSGTLFGTYERFEAAHSFIEDLDGNTQTNIVVSNNAADVKYGLGCGVAALTSDNRLIEVTTFNTTPLRRDGTPVYIEMDYITDIPFAVGLRQYDNDVGFDNQFIITLVPNTEWNKIYINATPFLQGLPDGETFSVVFRTFLSASTESGRFRIDNVKLVYLQN
jgi:hypothetical protein